MLKKLALLSLILFLVFVFYQTGLISFSNLSSLKGNIIFLQDYEENRPYLSAFLYFLLYVFATSLALPGAAAITLVGGAIFGFAKGLLLVSFASTIGATLSFLLSRYLFRDFLSEKFTSTMNTINKGIENEGKLYLFALRLAPIFPFFLINLLMGLTKFPARTFFWISQIGMLPGTAVYVNAGLQLSKINSLRDVLSFELFISFCIIGILPLLARKSLKIIKNKEVYKPFKKTKPKYFDFDMIAIGGGAAGLVTSYISSAVGAKAALIEEDRMGGDCLNTGCVPSKAIIKTAHLAYEAKNHKHFGIEQMEFKLTLQEVLKRVHRIIKKIEPHDSIERYTKLGVECFQGKAKIISPWEVKINGKILTTRNISIATGATPFIPNTPGLSSICFLTSDTIWNLKELPKKLLVLGGGAIGCELAQSFGRLGSKVTIIERNKHLLPREDKDVSKIIEMQFQKEDIEILTEVTLQSFKQEGLKTFCSYTKGNITKKIEADAVLVALGRKARVEGFGIEDLKIKLRKNGTIKVNKYLQTNYPNIYACGDVTGPYQFTHAAAHQAWFCSVNGLFGSFKKFQVDYKALPWCTFTSPEVARVGFSEKEAKEQGLSFSITKYHLNDLDRAITDGEETGFVKVLTKKGTDKILGATIVGSQAGNMIAEFVTAMKYGLGLNKILGTIHIYPTWTEANKYAAGIWKQNNKPKKTLRLLRKYFAWKRRK